MKGVKIVWTREMDLSLGVESDAKTAYRLGICTYSVWRRRRILGIPPVGRSCMLDEYPGTRAMLGKVPDKEIASKLGITYQAVAKYRKCRRIQAFCKRAK